MFYERPRKYAEVMRSAMAVNGSFFNTQRMVAQYLLIAYLLDARDKKLAPEQATTPGNAAARSA